MVIVVVVVVDDSHHHYRRHRGHHHRHGQQHHHGHRRGAAVLGQSLCHLQGNLAIVSIGRKRRFGVAGISINPYFL
jgi:hypothetical protein